MSELVFNVTLEEEGDFSAVAVGHDIFTQADTWDELLEMVRDATRCHVGDSLPSSTIRLHLVTDDGLAVA